MKNLLLLFIIISLSFCKNNAEEKKLSQEEIQENYKKQIRDSYTIAHSSESAEQAIERFLQDIANDKFHTEYLCNAEETKEILLPNTYDSGTISSQMEPEKAWEMIRFRQDHGIQTLNRKISGKKFQITQISWKKRDREMHSLKGHIPGNILITSDGLNIDIEEIKLIIEHNKQFKVCIVSK